MRVAIAQINPIVGDLEGNVTLCLDAAQQALLLGADLVVLPELALPGCHPKDILLDPGFIRATGSAAAHLADLTRGLPTVILGTVVPADLGAHHPTALYNAAVIYRDALAELWRR